MKNKKQLVASATKEGVFYTDGRKHIDYNIVSSGELKKPVNSQAKDIYFFNNRYSAERSQERGNQLKLANGHIRMKRRKELPSVALYEKVWIEDEKNPSKKIGISVSKEIILHAEQCIDAIISSDKTAYNYISKLRKAFH